MGRIFFLAMGLAAAALGQGIPNPAVSGEWCVDQAKILSESDVQRLRSLSKRIFRQTKAQVAVLTVDRIRGAAPRDYGTRLFREWGLGSTERNDGVLVLVARDERAVEIIIGTGLTGVLPKARLAEITDRQLVPQLRAGAAGEGLIDGVKEIGSILAHFDRSRKPPVNLFLFLGTGFSLLGLGAAFYVYRFAHGALGLPPSGRRRELKHFADGNLARSEFVTNSWVKFARQQAYSLLPEGYDVFPKLALREMAAGLAIGAAALAAYALAAIGMDLEPSWWKVGGILGIACLAVPGVFYLTLGDDAETAKVLSVLTVFVGLLPMVTLFEYFWSDYSIVTYLTPLWVALIGGIAGYWIVSEIGRWYPERFACKTCGSALKELETKEIAGSLEDWEPRAVKEGLVRFRGWKCTGKCEGEYLVYVVRRDGDICGACRKPGNLATTKGGWRTLNCFACGAVKKEKLAAETREAGTYSTGGSSYSPEPSFGSSSSPDEPSIWRDSSSSYDTPSSGGTTDGDGDSSRY